MQEARQPPGRAAASLGCPGCGQRASAPIGWRRRLHPSHRARRVLGVLRAAGSRRGFQRQQQEVRARGAAGRLPARRGWARRARRSARSARPGVYYAVDLDLLVEITGAVVRRCQRTPPSPRRPRGGVRASAASSAGKKSQRGCTMTPRDGPPRARAACAMIPAPSRGPCASCPEQNRRALVKREWRWAVLNRGPASRRLVLYAPAAVQVNALISVAADATRTLQRLV